MEKRLSNVVLAYKCLQTLGNLVTCYIKLSFGPYEGMDWACLGPVGGMHCVVINGHIILWFCKLNVLMENVD